jgi:hypothetical protein
MASKIEQMIDDIEEYIDSCKFKPFSNNQIIVSKEELDILLSDLRKATPPEIKMYQKIISNKEQILEEAKINAQKLIEKTKAETSELVSQHEIMLRAYEQADEVVNDAIARAQEIMDNATIEANELKTSAMAYTDSLLAQVEEVVGHYMSLTNDRYDQMMDSLAECYDVVRGNRAELIHTAVDDSGLDVENLLNESSQAAEVTGSKMHNAAKNVSAAATVRTAPKADDAMQYATENVRSVTEPVPEAAPAGASAVSGPIPEAASDEDDEILNLDLI